MKSRVTCGGQLLRAPRKSSQPRQKLAAVAMTAHQLLLRAPAGEVGWSLVELQGAIESRDGALDGLEFAQLERQANGTPLLVVGTQAFEGQWVSLKKPLAVMSKQPGAPDATGCEYHRGRRAQARLQDAADAARAAAIAQPSAEPATTARSACGSARRAAARPPTEREKSNR